MGLEAAESGLEPVADFLAVRGLESLADRPVMGHDGEPVTLAQALASCAPARKSIDSTLATIKDLGVKSEDILPAMEKHINRMGKEAQETIPAPIAGAEKKSARNLAEVR